MRPLTVLLFQSTAASLERFSSGLIWVTAHGKWAIKVVDLFLAVRLFGRLFVRFVAVSDHFLLLAFGIGSAGEVTR
jgi:hypothetical protein